MIKNDTWIHTRARGGMIQPYCADLVREEKGRHVLSWGPSSYGYGLRLSADDFVLFRHIPGTVVNPKRFNPKNLEPLKLESDEDGSFFTLPAHSYGLGVTVEYIEMPEDVTGVLLNKSTYVRCGVVLPATVIDAGFRGWITLEIHNSSDTDCRLYANEGIGELLFFEGEPCAVSYATRKGKYMDQKEEVTLAKV